MTDLITLCHAQVAVDDAQERLAAAIEPLRYRIHELCSLGEKIESAEQHSEIGLDDMELLREAVHIASAAVLLDSAVVIRDMADDE